MGKCAKAVDVIQHVQSGQRVFIHGQAATPQVLIDALIENASRLHDVELIHLHTENNARYAYPEFKKNFRVTNLFVGRNMRDQLDGDRVDYLPCFLFETPKLFRSGARPLDVAMVHLSPPDRQGFCTLGVSVDVTKTAFDTAKVKLAQINVNMPRVHGDGFVHVDALDAYIEVDEPLPEPKVRNPTTEEITIGQHVANLIDDGSCLQIGVGAIPDAVLGALMHHAHLGIHSEMWSDGALALLEGGIVDNSRKVCHPGKTVSAFVQGTRRVYDFINDNPSAIQLGVDYVNHPMIIARNPNVVAINSAVEVDLTGQVCADSIGHQVISGVGGQLDFVRGAALSSNGKSIIAMTSRTKTQASRIVPELKRGAGVVTTRADVHFVVTEHGVADLFGKTLNERARALIGIAHPETRSSLEREWTALHRLNQHHEK